jgi:predicted glycoside hydrolase/deacetylase ChbG (UPF0249 family)
MRLILCADDYAQSQGIDDAIIQLIQQKKLSAASCMTLSPRWHKSAKRITPAIRKQAAIGLHLDFTHFSPAVSHPKLIALSYLRLLNKQQVTQHIHRQLDLFEKALGTPPDYVDGHQHVHQLPQIRETLIEILSKRYHGHLPWLRIARPPLNEGLKGWIIRRLGANALQQKAQKTGFDFSDCLLGVYEFRGDKTSYKHRLINWLTDAKKHESDHAAILMCHPSTESADQDAIYGARLVEFDVLNNELDALLKTHQVELVQSPALKLSALTSNLSN